MLSAGSVIPALVADTGSRRPDRIRGHPRTIAYPRDGHQSAGPGVHVLGRWTRANGRFGLASVFGPAPDLPAG